MIIHRRDPSRQHFCLVGLSCPGFWVTIPSYKPEGLNNVLPNTPELCLIPPKSCSSLGDPSPWSGLLQPAQRCKINVRPVFHILCMNDHILPQIGTEREFASRKSHPVSVSEGTCRRQTPEQTCVHVRSVCHFMDESETVHKGWGIFVFLVTV